MGDDTDRVADVDALMKELDFPITSWHGLQLVKKMFMKDKKGKSHESRKFITHFVQWTKSQIGGEAQGNVELWKTLFWNLLGEWKDYANTHRWELGLGQDVLF